MCDCYLQYNPGPKLRLLLEVTVHPTQLQLADCSWGCSCCNVSSQGTHLDMQCERCDGIYSDES
jgi:hypothetical protein